MKNILNWFIKNKQQVTVLKSGNLLINPRRVMLSGFGGEAQLYFYIENDSDKLIVINIESHVETLRHFLSNEVLESVRKAK